MGNTMSTWIHALFGCCDGSCKLCPAMKYEYCIVLSPNMNNRTINSADSTHCLFQHPVDIRTARCTRVAINLRAFKLGNFAISRIVFVFLVFLVQDGWLSYRETCIHLRGEYDKSDVLCFGNFGIAREVDKHGSTRGTYHATTIYFPFDLLLRALSLQHICYQLLRSH